jgi:hypothetical protein
MLRLCGRFANGKPEAASKRWKVCATRSACPALYSNDKTSAAEAMILSPEQLSVLSGLMGAAGN